MRRIKNRKTCLHGRKISQPTDLLSEELLPGRHELVRTAGNTERRAHICKPFSRSKRNISGKFHKNQFHSSRGLKVLKVHGKEIVPYSETMFYAILSPKVHFCPRSVHSTRTPAFSHFHVLKAEVRLWGHKNGLSLLYSECWLFSSGPQDPAPPPPFVKGEVVWEPVSAATWVHMWTSQTLRTELFSDAKRRQH